MKLLCSFTGVVSKPVSLEALALLVTPGYQLVPTGVPGRFKAKSAVHEMSLDTLPYQDFLSVQGGWWYRAEYHLEPGFRITMRIYNAAGRGSSWAVPLANKFFKGFEAQARAGFTHLLQAVSSAP